MDVSKFRDGRISVRKSGMKGLSNKQTAYAHVKTIRNVHVLNTSAVCSFSLAKLCISGKDTPQPLYNTIVRVHTINHVS